MSTIAGSWSFGSCGEPLAAEPIVHYDHHGQPTRAWLQIMRAMESEAEDTETDAA